MFLSRVEIESFLKSFLLFFTSLGLLIASLFYINYTKDIQTLDERLLSKMRVCSYNLKCEEFKIDFVKHEKQEFYTLYKKSNGLSSYYPIPNSKIYTMSMHFTNIQYEQELKKLQTQASISFTLTLGVVFIFSILFSIYALYPLRNALLLTQEFIKDILHDFNTPLASLRLNSSMLKREIGDNQKVQRIEQGVANILSLQEHLRSYLENHSLQKEELNLEKLVESQVQLLQNNYPNISFKVDIHNATIFANAEAINRIIENLLTNAAKYNKENGEVTISFNKINLSLSISDSGIGIKNPKRVFERFYKEHERGIGIGLHIVKKLCDELGITITLKSELGVGTTFRLNLSKLTLD